MVVFFSALYLDIKRKMMYCEGTGQVQPEFNTCMFVSSKCMELEPPYLMLEVKPAPAQSTAIILNSSNILYLQ